MEYSGGSEVVSPLRGGAGSYFLGDLDSVYCILDEDIGLELQTDAKDIEEECFRGVMKNPKCLTWAYEGMEDASDASTEEIVDSGAYKIRFYFELDLTIPEEGFEFAEAA